MTDTSTTTGPNKKTVAAAANQCLESFNKCLLQQSSIHPREFSLVEDQVARFSTWTNGIGVFAPGRASMDHRLRYAPEVQSITISLLESLDYRIQKLLELLHGHINGQETHFSSILDEKLGKLLDYIAAEISHLNKMSNIIRKASQDSQNIQARDFHMTDEEGNDLQPILLSHYKRYIGEGFPTASVTIQQRLADAMILRRKRILYRRSRYGGAAIQLPKVENKVSITLPDPLLRLEDNQKAIAPSQIKSATTLQPEKFKTAASSPSVVSTTMTVALGNHEALKFPTAPGLHAKRKYEQFKAEQLAAHHAMLGKADEPSSATDPAFNDAVDTRDAKRRLITEQQLSKVFKPDVPAIGEVTCPYCFYTLSLEEIFNEKKWQNHVKNDLDPYVCLFEECSEPDELYKHSEKWLSHMHQHIQRWRCPSHRELGLFPTCEGYMQHMRDVHDTKLNDSKLRALANRNARSLPKLFVSCPLCGKDESEIDTRLTDHITGHLRSLAIMSLPIHYDEDIPGDVGSDKIGSNSSQPRSRSTINLLDDEDILVIRSAIDGNLDDITKPSTALDATTSDEEDFVDMLFQQDSTHSDSSRHSEHVRVEKAEKISPELSDEQNGTQSNIQLENETSQLTQESIQRMIAEQSEKSKLLYPKLEAMRKARELDPLENTRLRRGVLDVDSDDTDMWKPQQGQTHAPDEEDNNDIAGPLNEQDMVPNKSQCWECQRRSTLCDGKIPICDNCSDAGMVCPGYSNARPLTWLPTSKVSQLQKDGSESASSTNRSDLGRSDIDDRHNMASLQHIWDSIVGGDASAEALREPMIPRQMRKPPPGQLQQIIYQNIINTPPMSGTTWRSNFSVNQRMGKTIELISNISLAMGRLNINRATDFGCHVEREEFQKSPTEEAYSQAMAKASEFFKKRQSQSSFGNTTDTSVRSSDYTSLNVPQDMDQVGAQFNEQGVHQGVRNSYNATINEMLASLTPEQKQSILGLPREKLDEVWHRWQSNNLGQMQAMDRNSMAQPQMTSQPQTMPQENAAGVSNQQQLQADRIAPPRGPQVEPSLVDLPRNVNNQSPVDESMVGYMEDLDEDAGSAVDVENNRRFSSMHQLLTEHVKEKDRMLEVAGRELEETQPERIRRSQYQNDRPRSPQSDIGKRMVAYVEDVDEDTGSLIGVESTRRYARSPPPRSPKRSNISKTRMPESGTVDKTASSSNSLFNSDSTPAPTRHGTGPISSNHMVTPEEYNNQLRERRARASPDSRFFTLKNYQESEERPREDDDDYKMPQPQSKDRDLRDARDQKDINLGVIKGVKKARRSAPPRHAATQPVVSQGSHRSGQSKDPASYGDQQPTASSRPRRTDNLLQRSQQAFNIYSGIPSEVLQVSDQEMMDIRSQKPGLVNVPDDQLRNMMISMKRTTWRQQQQKVQAEQVQANQQEPIESPQDDINLGMPIRRAANQQAGMQQPISSNIPPQLLQVSDQELLHIRTQKPELVKVPDDQLRNMIIQMKRTSWLQQQQQLKTQQNQAAQVQTDQQEPTEPPQDGIISGISIQSAANQRAEMRRLLLSNIPSELLQVSDQEMMDIRSQKPALVDVSDDQLRLMILSVKRTSWLQQQQQNQAAQVQANQQQPTEWHPPDQQGMQPSFPYHGASSIGPSTPAADNSNASGAGITNVNPFDDSSELGLETSANNSGLDASAEADLLGSLDTDIDVSGR